MICPRCGNEWNASKSPCTRCGLVIRLPDQPGWSGRTSSTPQKGTSQPSGNLPQSGQWSREVPVSQPLNQQSGAWQPFTATPSDSQRAANPLSSGGSSSSPNQGQSSPLSSSPSRAMSSNSNRFSHGGQPGTNNSSSAAEVQL